MSAPDEPPPPLGLGEVLRELAGTAEEELPAFRARWLGASSRLELEHLGHARDILHLLGVALASDDERRWRHVRTAWEALCRIRAETARIDGTTSDAPVTAPRGAVLAYDLDDSATLSAGLGSEPVVQHLRAVAVEEAAPASDAIPLARLASSPPVAPTPSPESYRAELADYAALSALSALFPERAPQAEAQRGLVGADARYGLDAFWQARFALEPELEPLFALLVARFSAFLRLPAAD
ncbi:MAG: hypothetical protein IT373_22430 [Polyangiaceae bacterium]|nr:hypothetical protein [Polyangiaceae bacterium]